MIIIDPKTNQPVWRKMPRNWTRRRSTFTPDNERCPECQEPWTPRTTKGKIKCSCQLKRG